MILTTLTGLQIEVEPLKGSAVAKLLQSKEDAILQNLVTLLDSSTIKVLNSGLYPNIGDSFTWRQAYAGDVFDALLKFRAFTFRQDVYELTHYCKHCGKKQTYDFNLVKDNRIEPSDEIKNIISKGEQQITIPVPEEDKDIFPYKSITFRIPTIGTVLKIETSNKLKKFSCDASEKLLSNIIEIEGLEEKLSNYINDLDLYIQDYLLDFYDVNNWGLEFEVETNCKNPKCQRDTSFMLQLDRYFFQRPRRKKKKK